MWTWQPTTIAPDGGGICGGEIFEVAASSISRSSSVTQTATWIQPIMLSEALAVSIIDISGYGTRSGLSLGRSVSKLDIGNGLSVYNEAELLSSNVNIIRIDGTLIAAANSLNTYDDVVIVSPPTIGMIDGGSSCDNGIEAINGGDAYNTNQSINGGDATAGAIEPTDILPYSQEVDIVSDFLIYKGWATPGGTIGNPVWRIQEISITIDGNVSKRYADGNDLFDNIWNDRATLSYA